MNERIVQTFFVSYLASSSFKACRGDRKDDGVDLTDAEEETDASPARLYRIPTEADFLIAYSVVPGECLVSVLLCWELVFFVIFIKSYLIELQHQGIR